MNNIKNKKIAGLLKIFLSKVQHNFFQTCPKLLAVFKNQDIYMYCYFVQIDWNFWRKTACNGQDIAGCSLQPPLFLTLLLITIG